MRDNAISFRRNTTTCVACLSAPSSLASSHTWRELHRTMRIPALLLLIVSACALVVPPSSSRMLPRRAEAGVTATAAKAGDDVDEYRNVATSFLGQFLPSSAAPSLAPSALDAIDWGATKRRRTSKEKLAADLFQALTQREWFVTGNVDPSFFDDSFAFQDPDVKISGGVRRYSEGVNKLFRQGGVTRGQIISCVVNDTMADTITVTWRLEGRVNVGPGLPIKAFVVYSDLRITPDTGLVVFQEDRFSLPGWDIVLSAFFPALPFLAPPAPTFQPAQLPARRKTTRPGDNLGGDVITQALFTLTETFSKFLPSDTRSSSSSGSDRSSVARSAAEMEKILVREYEKLFWVTGDMDLSLWEEDCQFADPFSSFGGKGSSKRFQRNAAALGSLVTNPRITLTSVETLLDADEAVVKIGWAFQSKLKLPWRPVLAAAGTTAHVLSAGSGRIRRYEETWKSKPWDVVRRLLVPTPREEP